MGPLDQHPIGSGFRAKSTAAEVIDGIDLPGRRAVVTGGYSGIGLETVRALVSAGAHVTVPARRPDVARDALAAFGDGVDVAPMDLADLASVRRFASDWSSSARPLHLLINNAGIMACPEGRVGPGWEMQMGVNHLGHMALYLGLEPALLDAAGARVVALSSIGHRIGGIQWDDPHFTSTAYDKWQAYGQAKTANALFAMGVDARGEDRGIRAFSVHPGGIFTPLQRHLPEEEMVALGWKNPDGTVPEAVQQAFKTPEQGAATTVWAATSAQLDGLGGLYCEDVDVAPLAGAVSPGHQHVRPWACDPESAERLWTVSEEWLADA